MAKYIDAELVKQKYICCGYLQEISEEEFDSIPAADVAPVVHGLWIGEGDGYADGKIVYDVWHCSECDYIIDDETDDPDLLPNYCPNCGAKMDKRIINEN